MDAFALTRVVLNLLSSGFVSDDRFDLLGKWVGSDRLIRVGHPQLPIVFGFKLVAVQPDDSIKATFVWLNDSALTSMAWSSVVLRRTTDNKIGVRAQ